MTRLSMNQSNQTSGCRRHAACGACEMKGMRIIRSLASISYPPSSGWLFCSRSPYYLPDAAGITVLLRQFFRENRCTLVLNNFLSAVLYPTSNSRICLITDCSARVMYGHRCRAVRDFLALVAAATMNSRSIVRACGARIAEIGIGFLFHVPFTSAHLNNRDTYVLQYSVDRERCLGVHY